MSASILGVIVRVDTISIFYEICNNKQSDTETIIKDLNNLIANIHSTTITHEGKVSDTWIICLNENDIQITDYFNNIKQNEQSILYSTQHSIEEFEQTAQPNLITDLFYSKIKSYFIDENIENIPLYILQIRCKTIYQNILIKQNFIYWCTCCFCKKHKTINYSENEKITEMVELNVTVNNSDDEEKYPSTNNKDTKSTPLLSTTLNNL